MNPDSSNNIYIGNGLLSRLPELLKEKVPAYRYALITDSTVKGLYGDALLQTLEKAGLKVELFSFPAGEASKNEATKQALDHALLEKNYGRDTVILALGGGVVGDVAGFVAATYLRGIRYVQIPTTVLSMVDSSIGGKVGVNTPFGKNMIGAFWQPTLIVADLDTLETLPEKDRVNGWFEVLKIFLTMDAEAYELARKGMDVSLFERAIRLKIHVVERDERETGLRSILNLGHSVGHALEKLSNYQIPHGFAVALGMLVETRVSVELGHLKDTDWEDLVASLKAFGIHPEELNSYEFESIWEAIQGDKKNREGEVKLVLLKAPGAVFTKDTNYTHAVQKEVLKQLFQKEKCGQHETIAEARKQIESLDEELVEVLAKRMRLSQTIGELKKKSGKAVLDSKREEKLKKLHQRLAKKNGLPSTFVNKLFGDISSHSRKLQQ